ncbi:MAG: hypothetical protein H3C50_00630 [Kiritimatiellae bacterium]|nr:hypothetical protein [Kiritimatiellia bacterium]
MKARNGDIFMESRAVFGVLAQIGGSPGNYGGQTDTMMPQSGGPVIDKGDASFGNPLANDQRGYLRPTNGITIDLGAVETTADFDGDGVPDDWEKANGTDFEEPADGAADLDDDGLTGAQEYVQDSNPYDSEPFAIELINQTGATARITFPTSADREYSLQTTVNLTGGNWNAVPGQQNVPGTGGNLSLFHTNNASDRAYRIAVEVP